MRLLWKWILIIVCMDTFVRRPFALQNFIAGEKNGMMTGAQYLIFWYGVGLILLCIAFAIWDKADA